MSTAEATRLLTELAQQAAPQARLPAAQPPPEAVVCSGPPQIPEPTSTGASTRHRPSAPVTHTPPETNLADARPAQGTTDLPHFPRDGREPDYASVERKFEEFARSKGLKLTSQRRRILKRVFATHRHFTADEMHAMLCRGRERISRATVYRTLSLLVEGKFLDCLDLGGDRKYYEHILGHEHHDHIICLRCHKIIEFQEPRIEDLQARVMKRHGFRITDHSLRLFGYCADCQRTGKQ